MTNFGKAVSMFALTSSLVFGVLVAAMPAGDLSKYRSFQLGTNLPTVAKQAGVNLSQATVIHSRPALIQELKWRPQSLGSSAQTETARDVVFGFYDGDLFQIVIDYDRYEIEGLTANDLTDAISATYGVAVKPTAPVKSAKGRYGDQEEILAQWEDSQHRFDLIRSSDGSSFKLVGVQKTLAGLAQAAMLEAARLDDKEAPQREAARIARDDEQERAKLEKARLLNKPKFRP